MNYEEAIYLIQIALALIIHNSSFIIEIRQAKAMSVMTQSTSQVDGCRASSVTETRSGPTTKNPASTSTLWWTRKY